VKSVSYSAGDLDEEGVIMAHASRTRSRAAAAGCALLALLLAGCAGAPTRRGPPERGDYRFLGDYLDWMIAKRMGAAGVPGLSIAVVDDRRVLWAKGYGVADDAGTPATPATLYRTGSISKVLTAAEVLRRVEQGAIELDGALAAQLPGFAARSRFSGAAPVTVRALLAHHSGLPSDMVRGMWASHPESLAALAAALADETLAAAPQTKYRYSNLDYSLLGRLVEVRAGEDFPAAIGRGLLEPLGMPRSTFRPAAQAPGPVAAGHRAGKPVPPIELRDAPAGSLIASVEELGRFMTCLLAGGRLPDDRQLLAPETVGAMLSPQFAGLPLDFGVEIGLGWKLSGWRVPGMGRIAWHNGEFPGSYGSLALAPERRLGVVVLANAAEASGFAMEVAGKALELALEAATGSPAEPAAPAPETHRAELTAAQLDALAGDYVVFGQLTRIGRDGGALTLEAMGRKLTLLPVSAQDFVPEAAVAGLVKVRLPGLTVRFATVEGRAFAVLEGLPEPFPFERVERAPLPAAWRQRLGRYRAAADEGSTVEETVLAEEGGVLVARQRVTSPIWGVKGAASRIALLPLSDEEAVIAGAGNGEGGTVRAVRASEGGEALLSSGYLFTRERP
jgi:CubicO group peptidase (beta-lactamase class C family)